MGVVVVEFREMNSGNDRFLMENANTDSW